ASFVAGAGMEVFGIGWSVALQENIDGSVLSRAASYDALGSFVAIPLGQMLFGPLGSAFGARPVIVVGAVGLGLTVLLVLRWCSAAHGPAGRCAGLLRSWTHRPPPPLPDVVLLAGLAVHGLAEQVGVAVVPGVLLDHVHQDPAQARRLIVGPWAFGELAQAVG